MKESRGHLTRSKIAEEALKLLDEVGLDGLSMRKLGAKLGVEAMSLYNHVKNKADLLDAVHEMLMGRLLGSLAATPEADWRLVARGMTSAFLETMKAHPQAIPLFASRSAIAPGSLVALDGAIGILMRAGFTPGQSLYAFQTLFALTIGHALFHYGPRGSDSYARAEEYAKYPHLAQIGMPASGADQDPDAEFAFGIQAVIDGLEFRLESEE